MFPKMSVLFTKIRISGEEMYVRVLKWCSVVRIIAEIDLF